MKLKANEYHQQLSPCVMSYIALISNTVFATMKKHYCLTNRKMNKNCQNKNTCLIYKQNHRQHGEKENETKNPQPPSAPLHPPPKKPITMCLNNTDILCISQFFFWTPPHNVLLRRHSLQGNRTFLPLFFNVKTSA